MYHPITMNAYVDHRVTQMNARITRIHMIECVMSQTQSLPKYTCVYTYMINRIVYVLPLHTCR